MTKELAPADYVDVEELRRKMDERANGTRIDPYKHDASYEICQLAAELFSKRMPPNPTYADLDLFYKLGGIIKTSTKKSKVEACSLDDESKKILVAALEATNFKRYDNRVDGDVYSTGKFGLFNTPIGTFGCVGGKSGVPDEAIRGIIQLFAREWEMLESGTSPEKMYRAVEEVFGEWVRGIQAASLSQILHCIAPEVFPILNGQQGRDSVYVCLGAKGLSNLGDATAYGANCRAIERFREERYPQVRNYREFDIVGFELPRVHARQSSDDLEGVSNLAAAGAIEDLSNDPDCFAEIEERDKEFNVFDVLDITTTEIRHSRMLGWFLNPGGSHGLGDTVLRRFLVCLLNTEATVQADSGDLSEAATGDLSSFYILREKDNMDLRVVSDRLRHAVIIENKVFSDEHDEQLARYGNEAEKAYGGYFLHYVYLTPDGKASSEPGKWVSMSYRQVMEWVGDALDEMEPGIPLDRAIVIRQYLDVVRRKVMGEDEMIELCRSVYAKHRTAIDLIIHHREQIEESLGIHDDARLTADLLMPHLKELGFEGVFNLRTGRPIPVERDGIVGIPAGQGFATLDLGTPAEISADALARKLMILWGEVEDLRRHGDSDPAIQLSLTQADDEDPTTKIRVFNCTEDEEHATILARERGLSAVLDLSNDSIKPVGD